MEDSETRAHLVRLAARLIRDEGCAAVTAGRLAEALGLKRQTVHYYFGTIEELFIAVLRTGVDKMHARVKQELDCEEPLRVIYRLGSAVSSTLFEFTAMAMRSKAIRAEMRHYVDEFHKLQAQALAGHLAARDLTPNIPPAAMAFVVNSVAHTFAVEAALGVSQGHEETMTLMEDWLQAFAQSGEWTTRAPVARPKLRIG